MISFKGNLDKPHWLQKQNRWVHKSHPISRLRRQALGVYCGYVGKWTLSLPFWYHISIYVGIVHIRPYTLIFSYCNSDQANVTKKTAVIAWAHCNIKTVFIRIGIYFRQINRSWDRLIFIVRILIQLGNVYVKTILGLCNSFPQFRRPPDLRENLGIEYIYNIILLSCLKRFNCSPMSHLDRYDRCRDYMWFGMNLMTAAKPFW